MRDDKLQEIIELLPYSIRYSGEIEELLDYAREQAERVYELEEKLHFCEMTKLSMDSVEKYTEQIKSKNNRYREALEEIMRTETVTTSLAKGRVAYTFSGHIARKALEESE